MLEVGRQLKARPYAVATCGAGQPEIGGSGLGLILARGMRAKPDDTATLMARRRMLSPEMFTSETVAQWPVDIRWTWAGVLTYLDDYGYGQDSPALVKATVWPHDDGKTLEVVGRYLDVIAASGSLCRFECCGQKQMHAPTWKDWQTVAHPSKARRCVCPHPQHSRNSHEEHRKVSREHHESLALREVNTTQENLSDSGEGLAEFRRVREQLGHSA